MDTEWELALYAFNEIVKRFGKPTIDLFASRINSKCSKYCSWERDPEAFAINALTINWKNDYWYAFRLFTLITRIFKKIRDEESKGILVVLFWTVQPWYVILPEFSRLLISNLIFFNKILIFYFHLVMKFLIRYQGV